MWPFKKQSTEVGPVTGEQLIVKPDTFVVRVPDHYYQIMYDVAYADLRRGLKLAVRQEKQKNLLLDWVEKNYPSYTLANFADYSNEEVAQIKSRTGKEIKWGMYLLLTNRPLNELGTDATAILGTAPLLPFE